MNNSRRIKHTRFIVLFYVTVVLFIILFARLITVQARSHGKYSEMADVQHVGRVKINALRGRIFDRNSTLMAFSLSQPSVAANPSKIKDREWAAFCLSLALNRKKEDVLKQLNTPVNFIWIARKIDVGTAKQIEKLKLPGIRILGESSGKRFHPKKKVASHVLGYTGIDDQGLDGIEASYDDLLTGKHGFLEGDMDERGRILPGTDNKLEPPVPGKDVYLTIDETVQYIVEKELKKTVEKFKAAGGTVIVYDASNGDVLALASYPDFDPSHPYKIDKKAVRNKAVVDNYEPGSTFKVILAAAALDSGKVTTTDTFYSGKVLHVGGYGLRNADDGLWSPTNYETVEGVITYSFNTGAASIGLRIGKDIFYKYVEAFGFGKATGIDLPGEAEGILAIGKYWKPINLATISYGQGISVTPIQMVQAYGAIANDGVMMKPRVVRKIMNQDGTLYRDNKPKVVGKVLKPQTCRKLLKILHNVSVNGTAKKARIPGFKIGGKTGTANMVLNGVYSKDRYIASFIGVLPVDDPRLIILVKIDEPNVIWGGSVAAPVFKNVGEKIVWRLGIQPSKKQDLSQIIKSNKDKRSKAN